MQVCMHWTAHCDGAGGFTDDAEEVCTIHKGQGGEVQVGGHDDVAGPLLHGRLQCSSSRHPRHCAGLWSREGR